MESCYVQMIKFMAQLSYDLIDQEHSYQPIDMPRDGTHEPKIQEPSSTNLSIFIATVDESIVVAIQS